MSNPEPVGATTYECLHVVRKRCWECGAGWEGPAFTPQPAGAPPLPAMCPRCIGLSDERVRLAEARFAALKADASTVPPPDAAGRVPELERPRRTVGNDE